MNNKGFTLIELLVTIMIISIAMISFVIIINNSFSLTDDKAYDIMKKGIVAQVNQYILECDNGIIDCDGDYVWDDNGSFFSTSFILAKMVKYSYFNENDLINPISGENISNCLIVNVVKDKYSTFDITLDDSNCMK